MSFLLDGRSAGDVVLEIYGPTRGQNVSSLTFTTSDPAQFTGHIIGTGTVEMIEYQINRTDGQGLENDTVWEKIDPSTGVSLGVFNSSTPTTINIPVKNYIHAIRFVVQTPGTGRFFLRSFYPKF